MGAAGGNNATSPAIAFQCRLDWSIDELIGL